MSPRLRALKCAEAADEQSGGRNHECERGRDTTCMMNRALGRGEGEDESKRHETQECGSKSSPLPSSSSSSFATFCCVGFSAPPLSPYAPPLP